MIGIVVINYKNEALTRAFVERECARMAAEHVVVIVNNGAEHPELLPFGDGIHILDAGGNIGFARANNLGTEWLLEQVNPEYILFSNNDIRLREDDVIEQLISCLETHVDAAAAGPEIIGPDGRRQGPEPRMGFAQRHLLPYWGKFFIKRDNNYAQRADEGFHYRISGAFFLARSRDFFEAGMFDSATFLYGEESILSERFAGIGKKVWFCPRVGVFHEHGATVRKQYDYARMRRLKFDSECYYFRQYLGTPRWQILLGRFTLFLKELLGR